MATRIWISSSGDWSSGASWSGGVAPVGGDNVLFINNGAVAVTSGLSQGTVDLNVFEIIGFPNDIGSSVAPLIIGATKLIHRGTGSVFYQNDYTGAGETIWVSSDNRVNAMTLTGSSGISRLVCLSGATFINGPTIVLLQTGFRRQAAIDRDAVVTVQGASVVNEIYMSGGTVLDDTTTGSTSITYKSRGIYRVGETDLAGQHYVYQAGGEFKYTGETAASPGAPNIERLVLGGGAAYLNEPHAVSEIRNAYVFPGAVYKREPNLFTITSGGTEFILDNEIGVGPLP